MENKEKDTSLPRLLRYVLSRGAYDPAGGLRLHLTVDAVDGNERIKTRLIERYRIFRETIGNAIAERREGSDADYSGWLVLTVIDGLMLQLLLGNDEIDGEKFIEQFLLLKYSDTLWYNNTDNVYKFTMSCSPGGMGECFYKLPNSLL